MTFAPHFMFVRRSRWPLVLGAGWLTLACGSPSGVESGVDAEKQLGATTDDDRRALCEAELDYRFAGITDEIYCMSSALGSTSGETDDEVSASCASYYDTCLATASEQKEESKNSQLEGCSTFPGSLVRFYACEDATVAELEDCATEKIDHLVSVLRSAPACSELTVQGLADYEDEYEVVPEACGRFEACAP